MVLRRKRVKDWVERSSNCHCICRDYRDLCQRFCGRFSLSDVLKSLPASSSALLLVRTLAVCVLLFAILCFLSACDSFFFLILLLLPASSRDLRVSLGVGVGHSFPGNPAGGVATLEDNFPLQVHCTTSYRSINPLGFHRVVDRDRWNVKMKRM